jgi:hypothetical protein
MDLGDRRRGSSAFGALTAGMNMSERKSERTESPIPHADAKVEPIAHLPNGFTLYREKNEAGGHRYWSDEVGGGVCVWDTCLTDESTLLASLTEEARRIRAEYRRRQK